MKAAACFLVVAGPTAALASPRSAKAFPPSLASYASSSGEARRSAERGGGALLLAQAPDGAAIFARDCATCHDGAEGSRATKPDLPGVLFSGSNDGALRAHATKDGSGIWEFDTNRRFETLNGVRAGGGAIQGPGPTIVDGMLYLNSGYGDHLGRPGNGLLAFGVE